MRQAKQCEGCCYLSNGRCLLSTIEVKDFKLTRFYCPLEYHPNRKLPEQKYLDKRWLFTNYLVKRHSIKAIARECKASQTTIAKYVKRFNIPIRFFKDGE